jgi:hypothetical protein
MLFYLAIWKVLLMKHQAMDYESLSHKPFISSLDLRIVGPQPVLGIWIWNNPNVLAGSESESKKKFRFGYGFGFGFRHRCRMKIFVKNQKLNTWKRKILCFSIENFCSLRQCCGSGSRSGSARIRNFAGSGSASGSVTRGYGSGSGFGSDTELKSY